MKGIMVSILEDKQIGNCSNNGISSKYSSVLLIGLEIPGNTEIRDNVPTVILQKRNEYITCRPCTPPYGVGYMFGGCFVYSSDSRFPSQYPIPLHDRQETQEQYNMLSK